MRLEEIQPSQLFISAEKLARVEADFDPERLAPLPVKMLGGRVIFTDGHTRALAAFRRGIAEVAVYWDEDELDWEAYEICVGWCDEAGIETIADLKDRLVDHEDYERLWYERCQRMHKNLSLRRKESHHERRREEDRSD